jgi:thioredoxin-related protein
MSDEMDVKNSHMTKDTLSVLLAESRVEKKPLFLVFGTTRCTWCRKLEQFHHDPGVYPILVKYVILTEFDILKSTEGAELYKRYGTTGFPFWTILDSTGTVLSNSVASIPGVVNQSTNVGYPSKPWQIDYYLSVLKQVAPAMAKEEINILAMKLKANNKQ